MRSFRFAAVRVAAICFTATFAFVSCAGSVKSHTMLTADGASLTWTPERPRIGDSVSVEAYVPFSPGKTAAGTSPLPAIRDGGGSIADPLSVDWYPDRVQIRWSFRVKKAGTWVWASTGTTLWSVDSVAGSATELKKLDSGKLWTGRK